ncbi:PKD domain-containing protein [bacterium SCSIO 12741]|nr:PKD domain-containing protein [bacterium SCSIO 12741]
MTRRVVFICLITLLVYSAWAEGTAELRREYASNLFLQATPYKGVPGSGSMSFGSPISEKMYIRINHSGEWIHMGFGNCFTNGNVTYIRNQVAPAEIYMHIISPSGDTLMQRKVPTSGAGYIGGSDRDAWQRCVTGPGTVVKDGYTPLSFEAMEAGDYIIEFNVGSQTVPNTSDRITFQLFDVSVSKDAGRYAGKEDAVSDQCIPGRLYSYSLNLQADPDNGHSSLTCYNLFPATENDEIFYAGEINLPDFQAGEFILASFSSSSPKHEVSDNNISLKPEHLMFLNPPDPMVFPRLSGFKGGLEFVPFYDPKGTLRAAIIAQNSETAELKFQIEPVGVEMGDSRTSVVLSEKFEEPGFHDVLFDGKLANGQVVSNGTNLRAKISYRQGPLYISLFNVARNPGGIRYRMVGKGNYQTDCSWDDLNVRGIKNEGKRTWQKGSGFTLVTRFYNFQEDSYYNLAYYCKPDSDEDGVPDYKDRDGDNDGIPNLLECYETSPLLDDDNDLIPNYLDVDFYHPIWGSYKDNNHDGINDVFDYDLDSRPDFVDGDSDDDGLLDIFAIGLTNYNEFGQVNDYFDEDGDGLSEGVIAKPEMLEDLDNDGEYNHCDQDADGDGLSNYIEAQDFLRFRYKAGLDFSRNGIDDTFDKKRGGKGVFNPVDKNKSGVPDYLEPDQDGIFYTDNLCQSKLAHDTLTLCIDQIAPYTCFELDLSSSIDPNGKPLIYKWNLGDGNVLEGAKINHCYQVFGNYQVNLMLADPESGRVFEQNELDLQLSIRDSLNLGLNLPDQVFEGELFAFGYNFIPPINYKIEKAYWNFGDYHYRCDASGFHFFDHYGEYDVKLILELRSDGDIITLCTTKKMMVK